MQPLFPDSAPKAPATPPLGPTGTPCACDTAQLETIYPPYLASPTRAVIAMGIIAAAWLALYLSLPGLADGIVKLTGLSLQSRLGSAISFFLYDTPKVFMLLVAVVYFVGIIRSAFTPARARRLLSGRAEFVGNFLAAGLGVFTPFCSCSAVPLFVGFVTAGVPLGVTFSFLIAAPMVNEIALALLFGLVGFKIAALYLVTGLCVAIVSGMVIGRLRMDAHIEDWVRLMRAEADKAENIKLGWRDRLLAGNKAVVDIVGKTWPYIVGGIAIGAGIHGYVPQDALAGIMGAKAWWAVPAAVLIGVPMYSNAAGIIPVVMALLDKGAAMGTVLAFMMAVIALSLPEMTILRQVLKPRLIGVFVGVVSGGIILVGYLFNALLS